MTCPKCGFVGASEPSCARCGVIFAKLNSPRLGRPLPIATPAPERATPAPESRISLLNILLLFLLFISLAWVGWRLIGESGSPQETAGERQPVSLPSAQTIPHEPSAPPRLPEELILSGLPSASPDVVSPPERVRIELPILDERTITEAVVKELLAIAEQYPGLSELQNYAAQAHLMLARRRLSEGRFRESLAWLGEAERRGADPREVAQASAVAYLQLQDLTRAREWAQAALAFGADPTMYNVLGRAYYLSEKMPEAIEAWQNSLALREDPIVRAALEQARREQAVERGFDEQRLSHFIVKYEGETLEDTGRMVLGSLERSYVSLKSLLGFEPSERIVVILYTRRDYAQVGGPDWTAGLFDGKVRVPARGLTRVDQSIEATLQHELTHAFLFARAGANCPRWLQEGMAEYCEGTRVYQDSSRHRLPGGRNEFGRQLAEKIDSGQSLSYCLAAGRGCEVAYFYAAAASVVEYIIGFRGMGGIRDLLSLLGEGRNIDQALTELMGRDQMGLLKDWEHFVKRRYL